MKRFLPLLIIGGIIFLTCKKESTGTGTETNKNMDQQTAQALAPAVAQGSAQMFASFYNPTGFAPLYLSKFGITTPPCVSVSGDTTDADNDGYVNNATYTFNCTDPNFSVTGTIEVRDKNDNDPTSGFYVKITDFSISYSGQQTGSWTMNASFDINKTQTGWSGNIDYSFDYQNVSWGWSWNFDYTPDDQNNPWIGGTFNFEGNFNANYQNHNYSFTVRGENIHYLENDNCTYPDQGTVTVTDGTNNLVITFNCNSYTAEYNGIPVAASN